MSRPIKFPGQDEAKNLGYILYSSAGDKSQATYSKDGIYLTVKDDGTAFLGAQQGMIRVVIERFAFPNANFTIFEKQIRKFVPLTDLSEQAILETVIPTNNNYLIALQLAAEDVFQCEVLDAHTKDLVIGDGKQYKSKQDWIQKRIDEWLNSGKKND